MSRVVSVSRFVLLLVRARAFRVALALLALVWCFDGWVWVGTQRAFFASVGLEAWFWRDFWAPIQLFAAFLAGCLVLTRAGLKPLAPHADEEARPLRGVLARLEALRARIYPISNAVALGLALLLAREVARHGREWILLRDGGRGGAGFSYLGLDAAVWTRFLPLWMPFLEAVWHFSLALGFLIALTGVLRALPVLAAQNRAPAPLPRILWRVGAQILAFRALLFGFRILDLPRGRPLSSGDVFVLAPLYALGALWCAVSAIRFLRRARQNERVDGVLVLSREPSRDKVSRALILGLAALFLPAVLGILTLPLRALLPETAALKRERENATRVAWRLPQSAVSGTKNSSNGAAGQGLAERFWPVWDEAALLASRPGAAFRGETLVTWKSATLEFEDEEWSALLAGQGAGATASSASRATGPGTALALERLDLKNPTAAATSPQKPLLPVTDAFFGLAGGALFGKKGGIDLNSPGAKWAWAWRARDVLLPFDAATEPHLLIFRGARERAQVLAPFLTPLGEPRLSLENQNPVWTLDLGALSPHFPGAMGGLSGDFAGANAASPPLQMRMDARTGAVRLLRPARGNSGWSDAWHAAYPEISTAKLSAGAGAALGRAQAEVLAILGGKERTIYGPARGLNARGEMAWRVLSLGETDFELLESSALESSESRPTLHRGAGDLSARLGAIDAAIAKARAASPANGAQPLAVAAGEPFVWRDARAAGGFWIGRAFFAAPHEGEAGRGAGIGRESAPHGPLLWRVALTGAAPDARVGIGISAREARLDFAGETLQTPAPRAGAVTPLNSKAPSGSTVAPVPLEVRALQTELELQAAARSGDWKRFGVLAARQNALLKRIVAQRQNAKPTP